MLEKIPARVTSAPHNGNSEAEAGARALDPLSERSSESFGRFADYESPGCKADMAEGSAEEEQSSTAAPASPPADLRTLNTQLSSPYHHQPHLQSRLQHLQHSNMLATAVPPRHSHSMLSHQVKAEAAELDAPCDVPLNLKSEVSAEISVSYPHPPLPPSLPPSLSLYLYLALLFSLAVVSIIDVHGESVSRNCSREWRQDACRNKRTSATPELDARAMSARLIAFNYYAGYSTTA